MIAIRLPWPPKLLSPNARPHWSVKARLIRKYRFDVRVITQSAVKAPYVLTGPLPLKLIFRPPNRRLRDLDNCLAAFKAGLDGIADALGVNDKHFRLALEFGEPVKDGTVEVSLEV